MTGRFDTVYKDNYNEIAEKIALIAEREVTYQEFLESVKSNNELLSEIESIYECDGNIFSQLIYFNDDYENLAHNKYGNLDDYLFIMFQFAGVYNMGVYSLLAEEVELFESELEWKYLLTIEETEFVDDGTVDYYFSNGTGFSIECEDYAMAA